MNKKAGIFANPCGCSKCSNSCTNMSVSSASIICDEMNLLKQYIIGNNNCIAFSLCLLKTPTLFCY